MSNYMEYLKKKLGADFPGRVSREREHFERFGTLPDDENKEGIPSSLTDKMDARSARDLHKEIVSELQARDDALRKADFAWFAKHEVESTPTDPPPSARGGETQEKTAESPKAGMEGDDVLHPFMARVHELKEAKKIDTAAAMSRVIASDPKLYKAYMAQAQTNR